MLYFYCQFLLIDNGQSGAAEKTRTSTPVKEQRPQRCASTNSATAAHRALSLYPLLVFLKR